jgi:DNA-binding beta-propeller fold protein YncE
MRLFFALFFCALAITAPARAGGIAYILNSRGPSVSMVDMTTHKEVGRIPTPREPHHLILSPDGKNLLIGDTAANQMMILDPATGEVRKRLTIADPYQFGFSPDGKFLVVNGLARNQVDVYDSGTMQLVHRFAAKSTPSHLAYSPDSKTVYVSLQDSDSLVAFDLTTMTQKWVAPTGKTPAGVIWLNGTVLVACMGTDSIFQADPANGRTIQQIQTGKSAHQLFLSPDKKTLWVNNREGGTTVSLDAKTLSVIRRYQISGGPDDIDFAPDGKLWITRRFAASVAVLDPGTGNIETIEVGRSPHGIWLNPRATAPAKGPGR